MIMIKMILVMIGMIRVINDVHDNDYDNGDDETCIMIKINHHHHIFLIGARTSLGRVVGVAAPMNS